MPRPTPQPTPRGGGKPSGRGNGGNDGNDIPCGVCLRKAVDGSCTDKLCKRKHDAESIKKYKAALGQDQWELKRKWWKARAISRDPAPAAAPTRRANATDDKGEADTDSDAKASKSGGRCKLFGDGGTWRQGSSHFTFT